MSDTFNKTEQPTQRRLDKAREKGQVPQSQEMLSAITLLTLIGVTALMGSHFLNWSMELLRSGFSCQAEMFDNAQSFGLYAKEQILGMLGIMAPFLIMLIITGIGGSILVSGLNFTPAGFKTGWQQLNPINGVKNLFSPESLVKLGFSIIKLGLIGFIVWWYLKDKLETIATIQWMASLDLLAAIAKMIFGVALRICLGLLVVGIADLIYRRWRHIEKLKMTKQEVKDERRDTDGAPEIKSKIRQKQFEAAMRRMLQDVPKANVVLVNPDHVAVALKYDPNVSAAPVVVARGADHMCEKIKEIARSYGVPILRRPPLARELYATVKIGHPIPEKLYTVVAEILALIFRLRHAR